jgi:hypothetical protein
MVLLRFEIRPLVLLPKRLTPTDGGFMKFASFPKFALLLSLAGILTLALTGCGSTISNLGLTQGNWAFSASSATALVTSSSPSFALGGNLTQSGTNLTGTMYITQSVCIVPQFVSFTGTVKDKNVTLTSASFGGQVISITASGSNNSLSGTYTVTGECADSGTLTASAVPSISGTWTGTVQVSAAPVTMSIALTQAATASPGGTFALTGTVTYTGSVCSSSATISPSSLQGTELNLNADLGTGSFNYSASLNSAATPTSITGTYSVTDECASDQDQTVTLTKQ